MPSLPTDPIAWWWPCLLGIALLGWWFAATRTRRSNARRASTASTAEARAERLLAAQGYKVHQRQVTHTFPIHIDGETHDVTCRADLIVRRKRRTYVAEVKSSGHHTDPTHPSTRRQLLEYRMAFDVHGVLLVDMARGRITEVDFPLLRAKR